MNKNEKAFRETMNKVVKNLQLPNSPSKMSPARTYSDPNHLALNRALAKVKLPPISPVRKSLSMPNLKKSTRN